MREYCDALGKRTLGVTRESELPYPKDHIRSALLHALELTSESRLRDQLRDAYVHIETFVSDEDFLAVSVWENGVASNDPATLLGRPANEASRVLNAVSERMAQRAAELRQLLD